jgi:hypothetical protein
MLLPYAITDKGLPDSQQFRKLIKDPQAWRDSSPEGI